MLNNYIHSYYTYDPMYTVATVSSSHTDIYIYIYKYKYIYIYINTCLPKDHAIHKIVSRDTVKVSYKCMPSFKTAITRHNKNVMKSEQVPAAPPGCNFRDNPCPLQTSCYQTDHVTNENQNTNSFTGVTRYTFKIYIKRAIEVSRQSRTDQHFYVYTPK